MIRLSWSSFVIQFSCWLAARLAKLSVHKCGSKTWKVTYLRDRRELQVRKMTGGLRSKTRGSIHASSGPKQNLTQAALVTCTGMREQHEASLVRGIFLPSTELPLHPYRQRISLPAGPQKSAVIGKGEIQHLRAAFAASWNWMSSEESSEACSWPMADMTAAEDKSPRRCSSVCWAREARLCATTGFQRGGSRLQQNIKNAARDSLMCTSARAKADWPRSLM